MLIRKFPQKIKLICGFIYKDNGLYKKTLSIMKNHFGPIDYETKPVPFEFTEYYGKEMGAPLYRRFIAFNRLIEHEKLVKIKLYCINLERKLSAEGKRRINIDPGYINMARLVLFTTKDFSHRIYMGKGIYAEITLIYVKKSFKDLAWTYPDYKTLQYKQFFSNIRNIYKNQIDLKKLATPEESRS